MCGIAGFYSFQKKFSETDLHAMTNALAHRGPDGNGIWSEANIGLAHQRLAIIDTSELGHQPMLSSDGSLIIVYNGEIYNFQTLRKELERLGYLFHSKTDTEVILNSYHLSTPKAFETVPKYLNDPPKCIYLQGCGER